MSLESLGNDTFSSSRWTHGRHENDVLNDHERLVFLRTVIPSLMIHPLSQEFNRGLCTVLLFLWHIEIINKQYKPLACRWAINTFSSLLKFFVQGILSLISGSLCRESNWNVLVILRELILQHDLDIYCFSCTCWTWT